MNLLTLLVLLPLLGFVVNGLFGPRLGPRFVRLVGCGLPATSFVLALLAWWELEATGGVRSETAFTWALIGDQEFSVQFYFDRLAAVMSLVVTGVGSLIHLYSVGYMHGDPGFARYFAYLNLFLFFMLLLVLGQSLLVLFVGWEGVGLASYLLIGFWFEDPEKARAGKKAFITNRIGDAAFLLGLFWLYSTLGTLDLPSINAAWSKPALPAVSASLVGLLLFIGATGKSAQIPLYVWLPDAMAGPTPVSALIHAATMVTAGVYLIARLSGLYLHAVETSQLIAVVGVATAFFAATIALVQTDIKKVLAYSTISQLGFMFLALGVGAYGVAVFHVVTHAFFKACLFLGAGSVIHALGGEQDIRRMGGLSRKLPVTFVTFAIATAAIAGLPPLAGFFSKDEILWFAYGSATGGSLWLWGGAAVTALLTAIYMFRLLWLTFLGPSRLDATAAAHVHEAPRSMRGVLILLALLSAGGGFFAVPHYLEPLLPLPALRAGVAPYLHFWLALSVILALAGLGIATWLFSGGARRAAAWQARLEPLHGILLEKYRIDELYDLLLTRPLHWAAEHLCLRVGDRLLIDGSLHGLAGSARAAAGWLGRLQTGNLHRYVLYAVVGAALCLVWRWFHG